MEDPDRRNFLSGHLTETVHKEYQTEKTPGMERWTELKLIPANNGQYLAILRDTTTEHRMILTLDEALEQAKENNNAKNAFLSAMSHDIRTPMNGIIGMTAIAAAHTENPEKIKNCLKKITSASHLLLDLINEVLIYPELKVGNSVSQRKKCTFLS